MMELIADPSVPPMTEGEIKAVIEEEVVATEGEKNALEVVQEFIEGLWFIFSP